MYMSENNKKKKEEDEGKDTSGSTAKRVLYWYSWIQNDHRQYTETARNSTALKQW